MNWREEFEAKYRHALNPDGTEQCNPSCTNRHEFFYSSTSIDKMEAFIESKFEEIIDQAIKSNEESEMEYNRRGMIFLPSKYITGYNEALKESIKNLQLIKSKWLTK